MNINDLIQNLQFVNIFWELITPLIFMLADVITGIIQAVINKNLDSKVMREGLLRKAILVVILILSVTLEKAFGMQVISKIVSIYLIVMEILSIAENITKAGINIPKFSELLKSPIEKEEEEK